MHTYTILKGKNHNLITVTVTSNNQGDQLLDYHLERNDGSICHFHDSYPEGEHVDVDYMEILGLRMFTNETDVKKALKSNGYKKV